MTWKCSNKTCGRTFPLAARITTKTTVPNVFAAVPGAKEEITMLEQACCPFCKSIEFEEVKE